MGERKVVNKYYPPDFDPSKVPRGKRPPNDQMKIRSMMPMSVRCNNCGEYIYRGKKFNVRKETVEGETYLGIRIFRFYFRCPRCSVEFTLKTDPQNGDYVCEHGVNRNFEPWKERERLIQEALAEREKEEEGDTMKLLENKTKDTKMEMDILEALDEIRHQNAQANKVTPEDLQAMHTQRFGGLSADDERLVKSIAFKSSANYVRRIDDNDDSTTTTGIEEGINNGGGGGSGGGGGRKGEANEDDDEDEDDELQSGGLDADAQAWRNAKRVKKNSAAGASSPAPSPATAGVTATGAGAGAAAAKKTASIGFKVIVKPKPAATSSAVGAAGSSSAATAVSSGVSKEQTPTGTVTGSGKNGGGGGLSLLADYGDSSEGEK